MPKLRPVAQHFKEKGGYEVVGEVLGADMVGWTYDGPFDDLHAEQQAGGYPEEVAKIDPIKATVDEEKTAQVPAAVSITLLTVGIVLVVLGPRMKQ